MLKGGGAFRLSRGTVHCWSVGLDVPLEATAEHYAILTSDERSRSARFRFARDQQRFVVARGVLRDLLARYLGVQPGALQFAYNAFGKPELTPEFGGRLRFNLSHSAGLALIAVAHDSDIGIDLEQLRAQPDYADITRQFFSAAEVEHLSALPSHAQPDAFFTYWTRKEAYVKARGAGLAMPLSSFSVLDVPEGWSFYSLQPAPGFVGALAIAGCRWQLQQWQWVG